MSWDSPIIRIPSGKLNKTNDSVIAGQSGIGGLSKFGGQLGKPLGVDQDQAALLSDATIGTLYGGLYRYVKVDVDADPVVARGAIAFWDNAHAPGEWQVTTADDTTTLVAQSVAGIFLNVITPGNYGWVQIGGIATVQYRATVTGTKATGRPVVVSVSGAEGRADVIDAAGVEAIQLGWAIDLPADGALGRVNLVNTLSWRA